MRLPPQPDELLDRSHEVVFFFRGEPVRAFAGDTIGSALFASGRRVFSRSFKYHRPRGLVCCSGGCPNCMLTVDGTPNVRSCVEPVRDGAVVEHDLAHDAELLHQAQRAEHRRATDMR